VDRGGLPVDDDVDGFVDSLPCGGSSDHSGENRTVEAVLDTA
jgi:hypothetical protein